MINPQLELDGWIKYVDVGDSDDTSLAIGGLYEIANNFALGGRLRVLGRRHRVIPEGQVLLRPAEDDAPVDGRTTPRKFAGTKKEPRTCGALISSSVGPGVVRVLEDRGIGTRWGST